MNRVYGHLGTMRHRSEVVEYVPSVIREIGDAALRKELKQRFDAVRKLQLVA